MKAFSIVAMIFAAVTVILNLMLLSYFIDIRSNQGDITASMVLVMFGLLQLGFCIAVVTYFFKKKTV